MARTTSDQKVHRVLQLLIGLRNPQVATPLAAHGFDQAAYAEGWRLLREAVGASLVFEPPPRPSGPVLLERLDRWENTWRPIVGATLRRHHPALHRRVLGNLPRTRGAELMITVRLLIDRVVALEAGGDEEQAARALLVRRGLTAAVVTEARHLLAAPATFQPLTTPADDGEAVVALWAWYLEWSALARSVITNGHLLRKLGFRPRARRSGAPDPKDPLHDPDPGDPEPS